MSKSNARRLVSHGFERLESRKMLATDLGQFEIGLSRFFGNTQTQLNRQTFQSALPLIGNALSSSSEPQGQLMAKLQSQLGTSSSSTLSGVLSEVKQHLGQFGASVTLTSPNSQADVDSDKTIRFDLTLSDSKSFNLPFASGLPGLGLGISGEATVLSQYSLRTIIDVSPGGAFAITSPVNELLFSLTVSAAQLDAGGTFGLLAVDVSDAGSSFTGTVSVDLIDQDGRLKLNDAADLAAIELKSVVNSTQSHIALDLDASFGNGEINPRMFGQLIVDWSFNGDNPKESTNTFGTITRAEVRNITVDANSLLTGFLSPLIERVRELSLPFRSVLDGLNKQVFGNQDAIKLTYLDLLKVASTISGSGTPTFDSYSELVNLLLQFKNGQNADFSFFDAVLGLDKLVSSIGESSAPRRIALGSFTFASVLGNSAGTKLTITSPAPPSAMDQFSSQTPAFNSALSSVKKKDSIFRLDIIDSPINAFKLFGGDRNANLFTFNLPSLSVSRTKTYDANFLIYVVPVNLHIGGGASLDANLRVAYDANGIFDYKASGDTDDLFNGFYVDNSVPILLLHGQDAFGPTPNFLQLSANIGWGKQYEANFKSTAVNIGAAVEVRGTALGISGSLVGAETNSGKRGIELSLNDPNGDGKVRINEILSNASRSFECIFVVSGGLDYRVAVTTALTVTYKFEIDVEVKVGGVVIGFETEIQTKVEPVNYDWYRVGDKLVEFTFACSANGTSAQFKNPRLAELRADGTLILNIGTRASKRNIARSTTAENYLIVHEAGGRTSETIKVFAFGASQRFKGVKRIIGDAGSNNDVIRIDTTVLVPSNLLGGSGNDKLYLGAAGGTLDGGANNDELYGSRVRDILIGGTGNDRLFGGDASDDLRGGDGDDLLSGGQGDDFLTGGLGNDQLQGGLGTDEIVETGDVNFRLSNSRLEGLGVDTIGSVERARLTGGVSNNTFTVSEWTGVGFLNALSGDDSYFIQFNTGNSGLISIPDPNGDDRLEIMGTFLEDSIEVLTGTVNRGGTQRVDYLGIEHLTVDGAEGEDFIKLISSSRTTPLKVFGRSGADTVRLATGNLDTLKGTVDVDSGLNYDKIFAFDSTHSREVDYVITPMALSSIVSPDAKAPQAARTFGGLNYSGTTEELILEGSDGKNTFDAKPSISTKYILNGNLPSSGTVCPNCGDFLKLDTKSTFPLDPLRDTSGRRLSMTDRGNGEWAFTKTNHKSVAFTSMERFNHVDIVAVGADVSSESTAQPVVYVYDAETNDFKFALSADSTYGRGNKYGVSVATGDVDGDGLPDIVTAPGRQTAPAIKVFSGRPQLGVEGTLLTIVDARNTFGEEYLGGVNIAVGDVIGDCLDDIVISPARGPATVLQFENRFLAGGTLRPAGEFRAFSDIDGYQGGALLSIGDLDGIKTTDGERKGEIIVSTGSGVIARWSSFRASGQLLKTVFVSPSFMQGIQTSTGDLDGDGLSEVVVGWGSGGASGVSVFSANGTERHNFQAFPDATEIPNAAVRTTVRDSNGDGLGEIFAIQGQDGRSNYKVKKFNALTGSLVDAYFADQGGLKGGGASIG